MKSTRVLSISWLATAVLAGVAGTLFWLAGKNDPASYGTAIDEVQKIQQLAADWSIEAARVRADPLADFDSLAAFIPRMGDLKRNLLATVPAIPEVPDRLVNAASAFVNAVDAREERIERFKTGYAIIRNSARYLPLAAATIVQTPGVDAELSREISVLTNDINGYLSAPSDSVKGRLTVNLERLQARARDLEPPLSGNITNFIAHANVLLVQQAPTAELFSQATSSEITDLAGRLVNDLGLERARVGTQNANYLYGVLGAGGVLALMWILVIVRYLRSERPGQPVDAATGSADRPMDPGSEAARAAVAVGSAGTEPDSSFAKLLLSHRILSERVASDLAGAVRGVREELDALEFARATVGEAAAADAGAIQAAERNGAQTLSAARDRLQAVEKMAERLSSFAGAQDEISYTLLDFNACVREVLRETDAEKRVDVVCDLGPVPELFASKAEICLMLEKVVENSLQAIADAGRPAGELKVSTAADADHLTVTVIDNGVGMSPETRARMFEPFFAGAEGRSGVGLLSTSHLVEKYGGTVSVSSMPGGGSVVRIQVPGMDQG